MCRLRVSKTFGERSKSSERREPNQIYYFAYEGAKTEYQYFNGIKDNKKHLGINQLIDICPIKRDKNDGAGHPLKILEGIKELIDNGRINIKDENENDKIFIIFDRDEFSVFPEQYDEVLKQCNQLGYGVGVTNPCFEFWLALHIENLEQITGDTSEDSRKKLFENTKVNNSKRFLEKLLSDNFNGYNKSNLKFDRFIENIEIAIEQEQNYVQDNEEIKDQLGSSIGLIIEEMKE